MINCVTTKNELIGMFVSLGSEVDEGSVLSGRIVRVPVHSVDWHQVNASYKFWIGASNNWSSAWNNCLSAWNDCSNVLNNCPYIVKPGTLDMSHGSIRHV
jgi:hypothetical protein